jgi:hypothetical protein
MSRAALSAALPRLAKLLPMLASDRPGEVAATAAAINRTLASAGADLHDLADAVAAAGRTPSPQKDRGVLFEHQSWTEMAASARVQWLNAMERCLKLSSWELQLVADIRSRILAFPGGRQTPKQVQILDGLAERLWRGEKKEGAR